MGAFKVWAHQAPTCRGADFVWPPEDGLPGTLSRIVQDVTHHADVEKRLFGENPCAFTPPFQDSLVALGFTRWPRPS